MNADLIKISELITKTAAKASKLSPEIMHHLHGFASSIEETIGHHSIGNAEKFTKSAKNSIGHIQSLGSLGFDPSGLPPKKLKDAVMKAHQHASKNPDYAQFLKAIGLL